MRLYRGFVVTALALAVLGGCASRSENPILMHVASSQRGPDEFSILPTEPLQAPPDFSTLPPPTPGGSNLVDPDPRAEAVSALGGRPAALRSQGVPAADGALIAHAARHGVSGEIRDTLAAEDLAFRQRNRGRILERLFGVNVYHRAYSGQALDRHAELERWRVGGRRTPGAPPQDR